MGDADDLSAVDGWFLVIEATPEYSETT